MSIALIKADARHLPLADNLVHCVVTSPPYFGLRDYGVAGQLGLEKSPEDYVANLVEVFREVRRVLRPDGSCWIVIGDSYAGGGRGGNPPSSIYQKQATNKGSVHSSAPVPSGLKSKDLIMIPARVALALQADGAASPETMRAVDRIRAALLADFDSWEQVPDKTRNLIEQLDCEWEDAHRGGWYLRSDIIWAKPNPMPESVRDRPTRSHEYVFLLTKSARYFYDAEAVKEPNSNPDQLKHNHKYAKPYAVYDERAADTGQPGNVNNVGIHARPGTIGRNRRSVWTIATEPTPYAHFATYPRKLVEPCILAGTSERGCCPDCGAPWKRILERQSVGKHDYNGKHLATDPQAAGRRMLAGVRAAREAGGPHDNPFPQPVTLGWQPTCSCNKEPVPCLVLDPFCGSGTTLEVAEKLGRNSVGIDLSYQDVVRLRLQKAKLEKAA